MTSARTIRLKIDVASLDPFKDVLTGTNPSFWNGADVEFQVAFFRGNALVTDIANYSTVSLAVKAATAAATASPYMEKTVSSGSITTGLTLADWNAGTGQHCSFRFSAAEATLPLGGLASVNFWIVIYGTLTDAAQCTFGCSLLQVKEDRINPPTNGPVQAGNIIPALAAYDGSGEYTLTTVAGRNYKWTKGADDTNLVNGTETITTSDTTFIADGTSVTLNGTPEALVTAVVRLNPFLTADECDARYAAILSASIQSNSFRLLGPDGNYYYLAVALDADGNPPAPFQASAP